MGESDLLNIPGIGPKKKTLFGSLEIHEVKDLLYYFPQKFKDFISITNICNLVDSKPSVVKVKVDKVRRNQSKEGKRFLVVSCSDSTGSLDIVFFNADYMYGIMREGNTYLFYGKASFRYSRKNMANPELIKIEDIGKIVPIYKTVRGLSQNDFRKSITYALKNSESIDEYLPEKILHKRKFKEPMQTLNDMHFPKSGASYMEAKKKLIYEEFFRLQMTILKMKQERFLMDSAPGMKLFDFQNDELVKGLPFQMTASQSSAVENLSMLLHQKKCPKILLQGDVGTGKTLVAFMAARQAYLSGYQTAIMAPTELLAEQHFETFNRFFKNSCMVTRILTRNTQRKTKVKEELDNGTCNLLIGTHAIIQDDVNFKNLGLIITDERHRFGVAQNDSLQKKGVSPQIIVMSATPIPRTISEIIFGDMEILRLTEKPNNSLKPVETMLVADNKSKRAMYEHIRNEMLSGRQIFYVCPRIENENDSIASVEEIFKHLSQSVYPSFKLEALHGRLSQYEKNRIMQAFRNGEIDMIVSTTVIEVGIDVPNATVMAIDSFERFGLAQIHQLRGRVGRGVFESFCYLVSDNCNDSIREKALVLQRCNDGFEIAKEDMKMRGPGHVFSLKQHGFPEFKLADMFRHYKLLIIVQKDIESVYGQSLENLNISRELENAINSYAKQINKRSMQTQGGIQ
ncbi:MAG: ATP-dependent DNA helicase RecG [Peptostreptococcaceae bacterium]|nr:ATP-dependent DNA helicase RecG [Peptostreptococcaceae bacterium]